MRVIDAETLKALAGSRRADRLVVTAWRDGVMVTGEPLQVISWSASEEAGDAVKINQKMTLQVADPDGTLSAWRFDDPLSVAGTRLHVGYRVGGAGVVNLGRFRVIGNTPDEKHQSRIVDEFGYVEPGAQIEPHKRKVFLTSSKVTLDVVDLTYEADDNKFNSPQSPPSGATVRSEFARLMRPHCPVVFAADVPNVAVSSRTIYERERLEAGQDVLKRAGARYRMGGDGICEVYMPGGVPVARIGPDAGLVKVGRSQSADGLYNRWVVEGAEAGDAAKVVAAVDLTTGPLRYAGPHGRKPFFYSSPMIQTYEQAYAYADKLRAEFLASLSLDLNITTIPRPELQAGDRIEVGCPVAAGHVVYVPGSITSISRAGDVVPRATTMTVACAYQDVETALASTPWAEHLTPNLPPLTWDRMPGTWGTLPAIEWDDL